MKKYKINHLRKQLKTVKIMKDIIISVLLVAACCLLNLAGMSDYESETGTMLHSNNWYILRVSTSIFILYLAIIGIKSTSSRIEHLNLEIKSLTRLL